MGRALSMLRPARWPSLEPDRYFTPWGLLATAVVLLALALRLYNVNWDQSQHLHPDERYISNVLAEINAPGSVGEYFDSSESQINPYNQRPTYVYGTLPLFLTKAVAEWLDRDRDGSTHSSAEVVLGLARVLGANPDAPDGTRAFDGGYNANLVGRVLSALADAGTVAVVYFLGRTVASRLAGLSAALFTAFAPLHIQQSHFFTSDSFLVLFTSLALLALALALRHRRVWLLLLAGIAIGLALGSKISGLLLVAQFGFSVMVALFAPVQQFRAIRSGRLLLRAAAPWIVASVAGLLLALAVFRVVQPYAFENQGVLHTFEWNLKSSDFAPGAVVRGKPLYPNRWLSLDRRFKDDLNNLRRTQDGSDFPPNAQWVGRTPFAWPLYNIVLWGFGPFSSLAALLGATVIGRRLWKRHLRVDLGVLAFWPVLVGAVYGNDFVSSMRYFLPAYPTLAVLAGVGIEALVSLDVARRGPRLVRPAAAVGAATLVLGSIVLGLGFTSGVYGTEISRITASRWMLREIPAGTVISHENWDDGLPMQPPGFPANPFTTVDMDLYGTDSREKVLRLADQLDRIDVVVLSSNRLSGSIPRHPARYPSTTLYYKALEDGSLGYQKVAEFVNQPGLLGISWSDASAEEAFTVYDHPTVKIFRKTPQFSRENTLRVLQPDRADSAVSAPPGDAGTNSLMLEPRDYAVQQRGGTWTDVFSETGLFSHVPWLWWFVWLELACLAVFPWWSWICRSTPDRGYGLAKVVGPSLVALCVWSLVAWGAFDFSRGLAWVSLVALVGVGAAVAIRRRRDLLQDYRSSRGMLAATELVFAGVFLFFLLLRAANPDLWYHPTGGEKPMEVAYLTAVVRSTEMPPYDPWLAGGYLNYYYFGWFILAVPIRALQIVPEVAFNLGVPTFAAMAAAASFSTVAGLLRTVTSQSGRRLSAWAGGAAGVFLSVFAGNLDAAHQTIERIQEISPWHPTSGLRTVDGLASLAGGTYQWVFTTTSLAPYDWWRSSRVHFGSNDITEFPYWSFLFADLHPHLVAIPLFIALAGVTSVYVHACEAGESLRALAVAVVLGVFLGVIRMAHTWDLPSAAFLTVLCVGLGQAFAPGAARRRLFAALVHLGMAAALAQFIAFPYLRHAEVFNQGVIRSPSTTPPAQFIAQFGVFLTLAALYIGVRHVELAREGSVNGVVRWLAVPEQALATASLLVIVLLFANERGYGVVTAGAFGLCLLGNLVWVEVREEGEPGRALATAFLSTGLLIAVVVDLVTVRGDIGRMNTVFKFSLQAWHLLALGSAFAATYIVGFVHSELSSGPAFWRATVWRGLSRTVAAAFVLALLFPLMGTAPRQSARFGDTAMTLDGLRYLHNDPTFQEQAGQPGPGDDPVLHLADDEPLIRWLRSNVRGSPTIVEAVGPLYHWTGRYSINTGLPAVIGWDWHQIQQRGTLSAPVGRRREETREFYRAADTVAGERFLRRYDVSYVIIGPWERALGTPEGIAALRDIPALHEVFRSGENLIYRVDKAELAASFR